MTGGPTDGANAWVPVSACTPSCLPVPSPATGPVRLGRALRTLARGAALATVMAVGAVTALFAPLLGPDALGAVQRRWALTALAACGVRLRVDGHDLPEGDAGVLVVANHVSWLDVLALYAVAPVRLLAKLEVRAWPVVGAMAARAGTVFLDRDRLRELPAAVAALTRTLGAGGAVGVFPEGTTRCGRDLGSFRPAAFQAAVDAGVTVQPVALRYSDGGAAFVGEDTLLSSLGRVLAARRIEIGVTVLEPIDPRSRSPRPSRFAVEGRAAPRRELARRCETAVADALGAAPAVPIRVPAPEEVLDRVA